MEIWKDIKGYEGLYQASNLGRIKSLDHTKIQKHWRGGKSTFYRKGKIIKGSINSKGYINIVLCDKNNIQKIKSAHRIIALTWIDNPNNYNIVNHIDGNKTNNNVNNLEWCTNKQNINHAVKNNLINHYKFIMYDRTSNLPIKKFDTYNDIELYLKRKISSDLIRRCSQEKRKTAYGYKWEII